MESEFTYQVFCRHHCLDPETGDAARRFEEFLVGCPIEEWWAAMDEAAAQQRLDLDRDGGARL